MSAHTIGLDVSRWQGRVDYESVKPQKVEWVIAKATHGAFGTDERFAEHRAGIRAAGLSFGAYHWFLPQHDPLAQARRFVDVAGPLEPHDVGLAIDFEDALPDANGRPTFTGAALLDPVLVCLREVTRLTGRLPLIYTGTGFWNWAVKVDSAEITRYPLWHAQYPSTRRDDRPYPVRVAELPADPTLPPPWVKRGGVEAIWQFDGDGGLRLPNGVDVDVNRMRGTLAEFVASTRVGEPPKRRRVDSPAELQRALVAMGFSVGPHDVDGKVGKDTRAALEAFRVSRGATEANVLDALEHDWLELASLDLPADPRGEGATDARDVVNRLFPRDP